MNTAEKIKFIAKSQKIKLGKIAEETEQLQSNLSNKLLRNNFSESELRDIARVLGCELKITFVLPDGTEY